MFVEDFDKMDVDEPSPPSTAPTTPAATATETPIPEPKKNFVPRPKSDKALASSWSKSTSTPEKLVRFLARYPPSRVPFDYGPWISADRGGLSASPNLEGLEQEFRMLCAANDVSVATLDRIAKANNVLVGKWMVFEDDSKIDMLWGKVVYQTCVERKKGLAKVSTYQEGEKHVICVYVQDYTNLEEVGEVRKMLKKIGVTKKIGFKPDAYTHLNIYTGNTWSIRPSRYRE